MTSNPQPGDVLSPEGLPGKSSTILPVSSGRILPVAAPLSFRRRVLRADGLEAALALAIEDRPQPGRPVGNYRFRGQTLRVEVIELGLPQLHHTQYRIFVTVLTEAAVAPLISGAILCGDFLPTAGISAEVSAEVSGPPAGSDRGVFLRHLRKEFGRE